MKGLDHHLLSLLTILSEFTLRQVAGQLGKPRVTTHARIFTLSRKVHYALVDTKSCHRT